MVLRTLFLAGSVLGVAAKENPIRRIVTLMQDMESEIGEELKKEQAAFKKFDCYCSKTTKQLDAKIAQADGLIKQTRGEVDSLAGRKKQLEAELKKHKSDRVEAKKSLAAASKKRAAEKADFESQNAEAVKTLKAMDKAIAALEKGLPKSFLQSGEAATLLGRLKPLLEDSNLMDNIRARKSLPGRSLLRSAIQKRRTHTV